MKNAHYIHLAGHLVQFSLGIPTNRVSFQIFDPVLPFFLTRAPLDATYSKPSIDLPAIAVIYSSNGNLLACAVLLRLLRILLSAYPSQRYTKSSASTWLCLGGTQDALFIPGGMGWGVCVTVLGRSRSSTLWLLGFRL